MKKILITGGTGFLGKHVVEKLKQLNSYDIYAPSSKEVNLLDSSKVDSCIEYLQPDIILHMAALCGGIGANSKRPADFVFQNTKMHINLFESILKHQVKNIYSLGTVCSYPVNCPVPFKEDDLFNGSPEPTNRPYGESKRMLFTIQKSFREQYGTKGAFLIPVNLYGPKDHFDLQNSHVIPALIRKFVTAVDNNLPQVYCWGTGSATREFLYVEDAADAIVKSIHMELDTFLPINLGTGTDISIKDLAYLIKELTGYTGEVVFTGEVSDGQPKRMLDVSRAKEIINFTAATNLKEGLIKTIDWYQRNKEIIDD